MSDTTAVIAGAARLPTGRYFKSLRGFNAPDLGCAGDCRCRAAGGRRPGRDR